MNRSIPFVGCTADLHFNQHGGALAVTDDLYGKVRKHGLEGLLELGQAGPVRCHFRARSATGQHQNGVVGAGVAVHGDPVERPVHQGAQRLMEQAHGHDCVGGHERQHGGHVRGDHAGAFGHASDMERRAPDL